MSSNVISDFCYIPVLKHLPKTDDLLRIITWDGTTDFDVKVISVENRTLMHANIARPGYCDCTDKHRAVAVTGTIEGEGSPIVVIFAPDFDGCAKYWFEVAGTLQTVRNAANTQAPNRQ